MTITKEITFTQSEFNDFAKLSGDFNPIHVDADFSARSGFGKTVAHGIFLASVLSGVASQLCPNKKMIKSSLMFPAPTFVGVPMIAEGKIITEDKNHSELSLRFYEKETEQETCLLYCVMEG